MGKNVKLKKGYNINILGTPQKKTEKIHTRTYAVKPIDYLGLSPIPKLLVQVGDEVKAGDPLFYDKLQPDMLFCAPVSGEVVEVRRGEKRAITEIVILADKQIQFKSLEKIRISSTSREEIVKHLLQNGGWAFLRQRPYNVVADPKDKPKAIFISGFDTAPLAPDMSYVMEGQMGAFQAGLEVLKKLTDGKVHLSLPGSGGGKIGDAKGVEIHKFSGKHPAGNVGVQIHHIDPINKGEVAWTIDPQNVAVIGRLFDEGRFDTTRLVALAGPVVKEPRYFQTYLGANIEGFAANNLDNDHVRFIGGNVLSGKKIDIKGHLGAFDNLLSVIEEGDRYELFGWLVPNYPRPSASRSFLSALSSKKQFNVNTNSHGEHRAMVLTGQYERVLPMDLYPMQLIKAIMARDFELIEGLGIYEVVEEDLALCEFVCPSKTDMQDILREGLDYMREQA